MMRPRVVGRLLTIQRVLVQHGLDDIILATHLFRPARFVFYLSPYTWFARRRGGTRGERIRLAFEALGPIFVKFGQALSTRRDLLPPDVADELAKLQDRVPPFPGGEARAIVERALGRPVAEAFESFDENPLAAASIAQVHRARLANGRAVIVKVRRPDIRARIDRDMRALLAVCHLALALAPHLSRFRPLALLEEIWANLCKETDLRQEARNIRRFAEAFRDWPALYIPEVIDELHSEAVLVQEIVSSLPAV